LKLELRLPFYLLKMKSAAAVLALAASAAAFTTGPSARSETRLSETKADLEKIAKMSNPLLNYYDPMGLANGNFWWADNEATIGFLRQSEIKHGRIAMFAFVGYIVQSNVHFPWSYYLSGEALPDVSLSPEAQWDALALASKLQIFAVIACLEIWDETGGKVGDHAGLPHYMSGRQPGKYPSMGNFRDNFHFALDLFDPFGLSKSKSAEAKEKGLISELNNGRLAQIGIMGFMAADKVPGSVPLLESVARHYDGDSMAPFTSDFTFF
jgi:hypothetical protein